MVSTNIENNEVYTAEVIKEFSTVKRDDFNEVRTSIKKYKGYEFVDIRGFYFGHDSNGFIPTKKAITLSISEDFSQVEDLKNSLEEVLNFLNDREEKKK